MIRVFIGYDPKETVAYNVLSYSIEVNSTQPVAVTPVMLNHLSAIHTRPRNNLSSTEFSFTRFLVPFLCNYEGWALFMDCDMLVRGDMSKLWELRDDRYAVQVVKHDHRPSNDIKFLNQPQTKYEKKNWSSVMLMNCAKCKALTPEYVNDASGLQLHQFKWLENDDLIGEIPHEWNHLVGYDKYNKDALNVHFTEGGPYFREYAGCEYADDWLEMKDRMLFVEDAVDELVVKRRK
ncbi:glycosyltransferase [Ketobacter alkanivorans]|uniref:Glycosyltransferase n=1 Tax=Ketobacter alkanivorans TaxID=1917421 RepID=A0A2K9LLG0_9GAMM|nr:glycosyltransferase [Ketobacter alkanivorans]AUM11634.1 glycosyltransferase [Ketobacter alkanivorans]MCP5015286.1 glycosyltransferase [Ketobacter sp.]